MISSWPADTPGDTVEATLLGVGLWPRDVGAECTTLSGRPHSRLPWPNCCISEPDLPSCSTSPTDHLDLAAIEWLERISRSISRGRRHHQPRPLPSRSPCNPDRLAHPITAQELSRQLLGVRRAAGITGADAAARVRSQRKRHRKAAGIHPPIRRRPAQQGSQGPRKKARSAAEKRPGDQARRRGQQRRLTWLAEHRPTGRRPGAPVANLPSRIGRSNSGTEIIPGQSIAASSVRIIGPNGSG